MQSAIQQSVCCQKKRIIENTVYIFCILHRALLHTCGWVGVGWDVYETQSVKVYIIFI